MNLIAQSMKKINILNLCGLIIFLFTTSCSNEKKSSATQKKFPISIQIGDTSFLANKNYVFQNIENTSTVKFVSKRLNTTGPDDDHLYTDSSYTKFYTALNKWQKSILIAPFLFKEFKVEKDYVVKYMSAHFVAKQPKIGELQPIIISIGGDDYGSLTMILLDKNNKPVRGYNIAGGLDPGPDMDGDSLVTYEARNYAHLKYNKIIHYVINETDCMNDSLKKPSIIDSNVFESTIDNTGKIKTKQIASEQYRITYKLNRISN